MNIVIFFSVLSTNLRKNQKNTAIFGYSRNEQKVDSSELNIEAFKFEKGSQRILKNVKTLDFEKIEQGGFNLIIFGCNYSERSNTKK